MSFINWGSETPEQKEMRRRLEERELFEQAFAAYARSASAVSGVGSGKRTSWIGSALSALNSRYSEVTDLVPNIYLFWDRDSDGFRTGISDGGDDMYDGANYLNTNLTQIWDDVKEDNVNSELAIPYTHTQSETDGDLPDQYDTPPMDGKVESGDQFFGVGSKYFTNMYPGLFVMVADSIQVSEFNISGNVGSDGDGVGAGSVEDIVPGWTLFYKTNTDSETSDPSINHLILIPGAESGITHEFDTTSAYDDHRVSGIDDRNRIIYAVVARHPDEDVLLESDAILIAQKILEIVL